MAFRGEFHLVSAYIDVNNRRFYHYLKYGKFLQGYVPIELGSKYTLEELVALKEAADSQCQGDGSDRDLIEDAGGLSEGMLEEGLNHIDEMFQEEYGNLVDTPKRDDGKFFRYIAI